MTAEPVTQDLGDVYKFKQRWRNWGGMTKDVAVSRESSRSLGQSFGQSFGQSLGGSLDSLPVSSDFMRKMLNILTCFKLFCHLEREGTFTWSITVHFKSN